MSQNLADDALRGFYAGRAPFEQKRRRAIENEQMDMQRQQFGTQQKLATQRSQINEMQIEDAERAQLKERAMEEWKFAETTGELPPVESYQQYKDAGMGRFSIWHYSNPENVESALSLKPVINAIASGKPQLVNNPENIEALNRVLKDEINVGIGEEKPELGGKIVDKQISRFELIPESGGKIAVRLKVKLDNGKTYEEPMTVGRNANPNAPVQLVDARQLIDDVMSRYKLGKFYTTPQGKQLMQKMTALMGGGQQAVPLSKEGKIMYDRDNFASTDEDKARFNQALEASSARAGGKGAAEPASTRAAKIYQQALKAEGKEISFEESFKVVNLMAKRDPRDLIVKLATSMLSSGYADDQTQAIEQAKEIVQSLDPTPAPTPPPGGETPSAIDTNNPETVDGFLDEFI